MKYIKILNITILFIFSFNITYAQQGFMKAYDVDFTQPNGVSILADEGKYTIIANSAQCPNDGSCTVAIQTNADGLEQWNNLFEDDYHFFYSNWSSFKKLNSNTYITSGIYNDPLLKWQVFFLKINEEGDSLMVRRYGDEEREQGGMFCILDNSITSLMTYYPVEDSSSISILKMDLNLNIQQEIFLPNVLNTRYTYAYDIGTNLSKDALYLGIGYDYRCGEIRKIDTLGNEIWSYTLSGCLEYSNPHMRVKTMKNGNVVAKWFDGEYSLDTGHQAYLLCLSSEGDSLWRYDFKNEGYRKSAIDITIAENGDIIGCGYAFNPNYNYEVGWLFRVSAEGELLWEKEYISHNPDISFLLPESITEDEDGNLLSTGTLIDPNQDGFNAGTLLLKVLSNGCFTPDCSGNAEDTLIVKSWTGLFEPNPPSVEPLLLMPNPASCRASVLVPLSLSHRKGIFHIYDTAGRLVKTVAHANDSSMTTFSVAELPNGVYLLQYLSNNEKISSTKLVVQH